MLEKEIAQCLAHGRHVKQNHQFEIIIMSEQMEFISSTQYHVMCFTSPFHIYAICEENQSSETAPDLTYEIVWVHIYVHR